MAKPLHDPLLNLVRNRFLENISRLCLLLALGNFLCLIPLFVLYANEEKNYTILSGYISLVTAVGIALTVLGAFARRQNSAWLVARLCIGLLFAEAGYLLYVVKTIEHPIIMIFPILCFVSTPILGIRSSYWIAGASLILLSILNFVILSPTPHFSGIAGFLLIVIVTAFCAQTSYLLWQGVLRREADLQATMEALKTKTQEVESWVGELTHRTRSISEGFYTGKMPEDPPTDILRELSHNMGEIQLRLGKQLSELLLKDRLHSIGLLASGLAHEMNTPLTSLQFLIESSSEKIQPDISKIMLQEISRMNSITRQFLSFASPYQEGTDLEVNEVVKKSVSLLNLGNPHAPRITIKDSQTPLTIRGIKNQLEQVILNLSRNSMDSLKNNPNPLFSISISQGNGVAILKFTDNGIGIAPDVLPTVFDPFVTTKAPGEGFGLGLYIVKQIIESHRGKIYITSEKAKGTEVRIEIPLSEERETRAAA